MLYRNREAWENRKRHIKNQHPTWIAISWHHEPEEFPCMATISMLGPAPYDAVCHVFSLDMAQCLLGERIEQPEYATAG